ncbi:MAG: TetR/AcrR family transcriptional regulator [Thermoleophilia bacterium]
MTQAGTDGAAGASGRRARIHAQTRDEILDAAAELITRQGIEAFSLTDLAAQAGFGGAPSLYRYFTNKQAILEALTERSLERLAVHLRRVPETLPADEQIVELCLAYLDYTRMHPGERTLLLTTAASVETEYRTAQPPAELVERVFRLLRSAVADGILRAHDEDDVFAIIHAGWALAHGMAEYDAVYAEREREMLRRRHRAIFRACVAGFKTDWTDA